MSNVYLNIWMRLMKLFNSLWGSYDTHELNLLSANLLYLVNCIHCRATCCKHWICYNNSSFLYWMWKLAVIWYRLMCLFITIHSNMSNLSCWYK